MAKFKTIDEYADHLTEPGRQLAEKIRAIVRNTVPGATEAFKYDMPAFQLGGRSFLYLAVWKKHLGLYPIYRGDAAYEAMLGPFRAKKDTLQFALRDPLPEEVIERVVLAQARRSRMSH